MELDGSEEIPVVRQGEALHAVRFGQARQIPNAARAVKQAVMTVDVQVNEIALTHIARAPRRKTDPARSDH
jgi:hypothetical protein